MRTKKMIEIKNTIVSIEEYISSLYRLLDARGIECKTSITSWERSVVQTRILIQVSPERYLELRDGCTVTGNPILPAGSYHIGPERTDFYPASGKQEASIVATGALFYSEGTCRDAFVSDPGEVLTKVEICCAAFDYGECQRLFRALMDLHDANQAQPNAARC